MLLRHSKNIEVWRELWRIIDKFNVFLQIFDARNPSFLYAADLENYISEMSDGKKDFMLLINKDDFLSPELIKHWNEYFKEKFVKHLFFRALNEQHKIDHEDDQIKFDEVIESTAENLL